MLADLFDERLTPIISKKKYQLLKIRAEHAYQLILQEAPREVVAEVEDLIAVIREIEKNLLDEQAGKGTTISSKETAT